MVKHSLMDWRLFIKKLLKKHIFPSYTQGIHYSRNSFPSSSIAPVQSPPKPTFYSLFMIIIVSLLLPEMGQGLKLDHEKVIKL